MHTLKKFIQYYAPYKKVFFLDLICAAVISLVDLAFPQILRTLTKTLFTESSDVILRVGTRTRAIRRRLKNVTELSEAESERILSAADDEDATS